MLIDELTKCISNNNDVPALTEHPQQKLVALPIISTINKRINCEKFVKIILKKNKLKKITREKIISYINIFLHRSYFIVGKCKKQRSLSKCKTE